MKHKDLIIAWANGAKIEFKCLDSWFLIDNPKWEDCIEYRIHTPARNAFEAGKKVLARCKNTWIRLLELEDFGTNWDELVVIESDTYWKDKFDKGAKLEFCFIRTPNEWHTVTENFRWQNNSAYKFREVIQPKVFTEGPITITNMGYFVRTDIPITFLDFKDKVARIEIDLRTGLVKFI